MSTNILVVTSSIFGDRGASSQLSRQLITKLSAHIGDVVVEERDLVSEPLPHFSADYITALSTDAGARTEQQSQLVAMADGIIAQVQSADVLVITAPMYNFNVPSTLKSWFDYLARAGTTFHYTAQGPEGLLKGKKVYVITTRGGVHQGKSSDVESSYISTFLNFIGLDQVEFIYAEGLNMGDRNQAMQVAEQYIDRMAV